MPHSASSEAFCGHSFSFSSSSCKTYLLWDSMTQLLAFNNLVQHLMYHTGFHPFRVYTYPMYPFNPCQKAHALVLLAVVN